MFGSWGWIQQDVDSNQAKWRELRTLRCFFCYFFSLPFSRFLRFFSAFCTWFSCLICQVPFWKINDVWIHSYDVSYIHWHAVNWTVSRDKKPKREWISGALFSLSFRLHWKNKSFVSLPVIWMINERTQLVLAFVLLCRKTKGGDNVHYRRITIYKA